MTGLAKIPSSVTYHISLDPSASSGSSPNRIEGLTFIKILLIINSVKKLFTSISGLFAYLSLPLIAFSAEPVSINPCTATDGISKTLCDLGGDNIGNTIRNIVVFFVMLAFVIALVYLLYGGIKWITSKGDKTEVEAARNHIVAALIGLIVVILAVFLVSVVLAVFGINFTDLKLPVITSGAK